MGQSGRRPALRRPLQVHEELGRGLRVPEVPAASAGATGCGCRPTATARRTCGPTACRVRASPTAPPERLGRDERRADRGDDRQRAERGQRERERDRRQARGRRHEPAPLARARGSARGRRRRRRGRAPAPPHSATAATGLELVVDVLRASSSRRARAARCPATSGRCRKLNASRAITLRSRPGAARSSACSTRSSAGVEVDPPERGGERSRPSAAGEPARRCRGRSPRPRRRSPRSTRRAR